MHKNYCLPQPPEAPLLLAEADDPLPPLLLAVPPAAPGAGLFTPPAAGVARTFPGPSTGPFFPPTFLHSASNLVTNFEKSKASHEANSGHLLRPSAVIRGEEIPKANRARNRASSRTPVTARTALTRALLRGAELLLVWKMLGVWVVQNFERLTSKSQRLDGT